MLKKSNHDPKSAADYANKMLMIFSEKLSSEEHAMLLPMVTAAIELAYRRGKQAAYVDALDVLCTEMSGCGDLNIVQYMLKTRAAMAPFFGEDEW